MNLDQLLTDRNNELAKQDALIQDLIIQIKKLEMALTDKDLAICELRNELIINKISRE